MAPVIVGPGSYTTFMSLMILRTVDRLVIRTLQSWSMLHPGATRWLDGRAVARIGRALSILHGKSAPPWALANLDGSAWMSRSLSAERFTASVGGGSRAGGNDC